MTSAPKLQRANCLLLLRRIGYWRRSWNRGVEVFARNADIVAPLLKLSEVLSRVESLQGLIAGEFLDTNRVAFYTSAFGVLFFLTATRRLSSVRVPALLLLALCFLLERHNDHSLAGLLHLQLQWLVRAAYCVVMVLLLGAQAWRYQDESVRLRQLVSEQTQQALMKFFAEGVSSAPLWSQQQVYAEAGSSSEHAYREAMKPKRPSSRTPSRRRLPLSEGGGKN